MAELRELPSSRLESHSRDASPAGGGWSVEEAFDNTKGTVGTIDGARSIFYRAWNMTSRRMRATAGILIFIIVTLSLWRPSLSYNAVPSISVDYDYQPTLGVSPFNESKVALLIENRPNPILAPLMLHFMGVVPPDWRFRFMGSVESVEAINKSSAIRNQVKTGKLDLTYIPSNMSTVGQEMISRFLTNLWMYETVLQPAKVLLMFQTDSVLCANGRGSINDWVEYDWVGAPWAPNRDNGGNGGLSIRNVDAIIDVLKKNTRADDSLPEDVWLCNLLAERDGARMANFTTSLSWAAEQYPGEKEHVGPLPPGHVAPGGVIATSPEYYKGIDDWRDGFYEPLGYHTGDNGRTMHGVNHGTPELRRHVWNYCPEIKIIFSAYMDAAEYVPGHCNDHWKRGALGGPTPETVIIDGLQYGKWDARAVDKDGYPYLPANLNAW